MQIIIVIFLKKHSIFLILILLGAAFFIRGVIILDPDFGWHLREGGLILQNGIQRTDPFSYTMPSYQYIDHEWLTNVFISIFYKLGGIYLLDFIFAIIAIFSLFISIPAKYKNYSLIAVILSGSVLIQFFANRPQVITWFFLALLLKLIFNENLWKKWKYFVPLIFILWANLHGGFAIGIAIIFLFLILQILIKRKFSLENFLILLLSALSTFVTPYGPLIWKEVWMSISDSSLRWSISEWLPGIFYPDLAMLVLICLSSSLIIMYRVKLKKEEILIYVFLLFMAMSSIRHIPLFAIATIPIAAKVFYFFAQDVDKNKANLIRFSKVKKFLAISVFAIFIYEASSGALFAKNYQYPSGAVVFLKTQRINGNIMSVYNWGGYLIWKLPEKKVFVDGRMPSWRRESAPENESKNAFLEQKELFLGKISLDKEIKKYNIEILLLPKKLEDTSNLAKFERFVYKALGISTLDNNVFQIEVLDNSKIIYEDSLSTVYKVKK